MFFHLLFRTWKESRTKNYSIINHLEKGPLTSLRSQISYTRSGLGQVTKNQKRLWPVGVGGTDTWDRYWPQSNNSLWRNLETYLCSDTRTYYISSSNHSVLVTYKGLCTSVSPLCKIGTKHPKKNLKAPGDNILIIVKLQKQEDQMFRE